MEDREKCDRKAKNRVSQEILKARGFLNCSVASLIINLSKNKTRSINKTLPKMSVTYRDIVGKRSTYRPNGSSLLLGTFPDKFTRTSSLMVFGFSPKGLKCPLGPTRRWPKCLRQPAGTFSSVSPHKQTFSVHFPHSKIFPFTVEYSW